MAECGTLTCYIRGCRCEDCRTANREAARAHRLRVKAGTAARPRPPKREPKPPQPKQPRRYPGKPITDAPGWSFLRRVEADGLVWVVSRRVPNGAGWSLVKVACDGEAQRKANFWVQWNGSRMANGSEWLMLKRHRPALAVAVVAAMA